MLFTAPVSTSRFGLGFENGSRKTPTGKFQVHQKIGGEMPIGTVFKGRKPVTRAVDWLTEPDLITSRILWLDGLDQEQSIGQAASSGCVRMRNADVIRLFDQVEVGVVVEIIG